MTFRSSLVLATAALAVVAAGCSDPCGELRSECEACEEAERAICEFTVDLASEIGGDEQCQEILDDGGMDCGGQGGGS